MSHPIKPRWCARDKAWLVPLGEVSEITGRRKYVMLRDENDRKIAGNDHLGKLKAMQRLTERESSGPTVWELILDYLDWHEEKGSKATTIADYEFHLDKFGLFEYKEIRYYDRPASSITLRDLARVRESMEKRGCKPGYIRHLYSSVLACWRWAARPVEGREPERLLETNPFEGIERPKAGRSRRVVIPWPTIEILLKFAIKRADRLTSLNRELAWRKAWMLRLVAESGCRPKEACDLEWEWIDENKRVIVIPPESHKTGWRHGEDRIIGLTSNMAAILRVMRLMESTHSRWVFALDGYSQAPSRYGFDHWFADLRRAAIEAGIPIPPTMGLYTLRHSLVTQARQGGVSYRDLAAHMGHSEQVAENTYSHLDPTYVRDQFDRMHAARTSAHPVVEDNS